MRPRIALTLLMAAVWAGSAVAQRGDFDNLLDGDISQWESVGDGIWKLTPDGILLGYRPAGADSLQGVGGDQLEAWAASQAWLYTKKEYSEYDLHLDYFVGSPGNSGVSIRDASRGRYAVTVPHDPSRTPARIAYEIQIAADSTAEWPSGSIYGLSRATDGIQQIDAWNGLNIESRRDGIRVLINGVVVAEHPGRADSPLNGPIGLQLHDRSSVVMFRNVWIMER